jgi:hypothetical protein
MDIFSYTESFATEVNRRTLLSHVRRAYLVRALLLLPFLWLDLVIFLFYFFLYKPKKSHIFVTFKWPILFDLEKDVRPIFIGTVANIFTVIKYRGIYIPASLIYVMLGILPWRCRFRSKINYFLIRLSGWIVKFFAQDGSILFHHSDALPFARSLVMGAKLNAIKTVCIQHGAFHADSKSHERDGLLSDLNVFRSDFDASLVSELTSDMNFLVLPDLFLLNIDKVEAGNKRVILLGEGYHIIDKAISNEYLSMLKEIESALIIHGFKPVYRPHPSEKVFYRTFDFQNYDVEDLSTSLSKADAVIGFTSTVLFEASGAGIFSFYLTVIGKSLGLEGRGNDYLKPFLIETLINGKENENSMHLDSSVRIKLAISTLRNFLQKWNKI